MHLDVHDLREFYYRSPLGRAAQKVVRDELVQTWPNTKGETVVGYGFAVPLLRPFLEPARRVISLMPGPQGVMPWPANRPNVSVLCEETLWPLGSGTVDKLVLLHGLETSEHPLALLDECWRVLAPNGCAMFVVPNRAGLWSRSDATPFGFGRPYTMGQLDRQLRETGLIPTKAKSALYQPPSSHKMWRRVSIAMERAGRTLPVFKAGGVLMIEVTKQVPQPRRPGLAEAVKRPLRVLEGMGGPVVKPV